MKYGVTLAAAAAKTSFGVASSLAGPSATHYWQELVYRRRGAERERTRKITRQTRWQE